MLGIRRLVLLGIGVGIGLLLAPSSGAELRARLQSQLDARRATGGGDLGERVRYELSHSPRTWHLPQPTVEVTGATAVLRGKVPHEVGRQDLERAAAAVAGVVDVDNLLVITGTNGQP
jgi:osmotically-inducible protein OsmY